ncbi:hypothetical protein ADN00_13595 [Ornatilinea apprima]|uniref:DUF2993 domain-containing protein n=1 Tax=Ornatilinea apprima TaxID=1134406 RepID=A0A0P6XQ14_9CHLR|nr:hypothetical protein [Ornatilinea apprima]KPL74333.1 hypothetical protein ADN00_13595 [Ornatilinea apprima]
MKSIYGKLIPFLLIVTFVSIACNLPVSVASDPHSPVEVSAQDAQSAVNTLEEAADQLGQSGATTIQLTESQLSALLANQLAGAESGGFSNPQVQIEGEQIWVVGNIQQGPISVGVQLTLAAVKDAAGKPSIQLQSVDFGQFPAPQSMVDNLSSFVNTSINQAMSETAGELEIVDLVVGNDAITITVRKN